MREGEIGNFQNKMACQRAHSLFMVFTVKFEFYFHSKLSPLIVDLCWENFKFSLCGIFSFIPRALAVYYRGT
jgi:hypothetical protein